jgi:hypothetical protein
MIHVFYRHYNVSGKENWRPEWFDYEKCFDNFINSIYNKNLVKIHVIYDGEDKTNFIFNKKIDFLYRINVGNDLDSFKKTLEIIKKYDTKFLPSDVIYLLENDYLHQKNWDFYVNEFFDSDYKNNYLTLYDHADKYSSQLLSNIIYTDSHHYRTTISTCGSYLMNYETFLDDYDFNINIFDFLHQKTNLPLDHAKFLTLLKIKDKSLYSPIPGLSTHCLNNLLSPTINWSLL